MSSVSADVAADIAHDVATWRPATAGDLDAVERIGNAIHVNLQERPEVFAKRLGAVPAGLFRANSHDTHYALDTSRSPAVGPAAESRHHGQYHTTWRLHAGDPPRASRSASPLPGPPRWRDGAPLR